MIPDLTQKLKYYVSRFEADDEEIYPQAVTNADALEYLTDNIPLFDCPDSDLEKIYYFRWWTFRKHWKHTPHGYIITEFLPQVSWSGPYNSINCAVGHHLREARWLRDEKGWLWDEINFWLDGHGNALSYSMWMADALASVFAVRPNPELMKDALPKLDSLYKAREASNLRPCGLFWSDDDRDAMEMSISGPGIRPTLNSYMCGDAIAVANMATVCGMDEMAAEYREKADKLKKNIEHLLWDGDFYRTIPCGRDDAADFKERPEISSDHKVRELIGYLPWYFHIAPPEHDQAFAQLTDSAGFCARYGLTTAEQRHPRFMFRTPHECLWNGCVWPFATSQTLTAAANAIRDRGKHTSIGKEDYYLLLRQYALSHRLEREFKETVCWIDEDMDPYTGRWIARDELLRDNWNPKRGGRERGKDYNHSTFCDLVLSGLLGIKNDNGKITADPIIPESWDHFMVSGLTKDNWTVLYDRDGSHYGLGEGLKCFQPD